ncbi:maleylpyruvate isomerase N-terminal domain-containing protein [Primorskyibacter sp. 2E107]|uniref:maleylpyruvate isomerase N-terminal domain-containing protein n=1 Tax=Primorskyibacter sp. 2E107 TaxID=3403458 RepID=UPI003AF9F958
MSIGFDAAREAFRARQGGGARYDAETAPHGDLLLARRGTAYFARKLNALSDAALAAPALRDGWTRRHLIADISHQAREMALALQALRGPLVGEEAAWRPDLASAVSLPDRALRHLFHHSAKHLDVEWRDLPVSGGDRTVVLRSGESVSARAGARIRARAIWWAAVDLNNGGRVSDIPEPLRG